MGPQLYVATRVLTRGGVVETHRGKATRRRGRGPEQSDPSDSRGPRHWARQARARPRAREGCGPPAPGLRPRPPDALLLATCGYGSSRQPAPRPGVDSFSRGSRIQTGAWSSHLTGNYVKRSSEFFFYYASGSRDASDTAKATPLLLLTETGTGQPTRPAPGPLLPSVWSVPRPGQLSLPVPIRTSHGGLPVR